MNSERQAMGQHARRVAEAHFTWRSIADKLADIYRSALENTVCLALTKCRRELRS